MNRFHSHHFNNNSYYFINYFISKNNTSKVQSYATYEQSDHTIVFWNSKIWERDFSGFSLFCADSKHYPEDKNEMACILIIIFIK
ncbi:hypothetical protein [Spiroplasma mirum]|uniref:hypothetical protein n=1 Tax=Spiroplasma mirum TaxID=2144 RepID=UPI00130EA50E|nr:hypothetical protein [Spiroplasma atrichopogonis]